MRTAKAKVIPMETRTQPKNGRRHRSAKRNRKAKSKAMVVARPRSMVKKETVKPLTKAFVNKAEKAYERIQSLATKIQKDYTTLGTLCIEFKSQRFHLAIENPATGKPYENFALCMGDIFGKSQSTIFATMRIVKELTDVVPDGDLNQISRQNAEHLVDMKQAGKAITKDVIAKAKELPEKKFQQAIPYLRQQTQQQHAEVLARVGPFMVSKEVAEEFEHGMNVARFAVRDDDRSITLNEKALSAMAAEMVSTHGAEYEEYLESEKHADAKVRRDNSEEGPDEPEYMAEPRAASGD